MTRHLDRLTFSWIRSWNTPRTYMDKTSVWLRSMVIKSELWWAGKKESCMKQWRSSVVITPTSPTSRYWTLDLDWDLYVVSNSQLGRFHLICCWKDWWPLPAPLKITDRACDNWSASGCINFYARQRMVWKGRRQNPGRALARLRRYSRAPKLRWFRCDIYRHVLGRL